MDLVKVTDATIFKFQRPEKKWREKGYGDVTFVLKGEDLMVTLGKQSFFVKGTLKPKGPNAVVMRVWGVEACSEEPDMILAVRFAKEGDLERLAGMLSDKKLDKRKTRTSRMSRRSMKSPLPPWFASMEKSKRNSIQNLIKNAKPKYLKDGTIRMQLAQMYDLSPGQIQWVIDFFLSWRHVGKMRQTHRRAVSCSLNSLSSFPSLSFHNSGAPMRHISQGASPANNGSNQMVNGRHIRLQPSGLAFPSRRNHRSRGNLSDFSTQLIRSPGISSSFHRPADIEANPNTQICMSPELNNTNNPHVLRPISGFDSNEKLRGTPKVDHGQFNQQNVAHLMPIVENLNPSNSNDGSSSHQVRSANETNEEDSNLPPLSPLTEQNLVLYNRLKPPLKGDFRSIVSTWLQKSVP